MITIKDAAETSFVVKKSKFIGLAIRVENEHEAQAGIEKRRKQHYDATHNCFAYVLENGVMRYSDDGEPQGTAGQPMLEVIKRTGLSNVLFICTRYFGGTLLGAGGLVHAYTKSAADTLGAAQKVELIPCSIFKCSFSYGVWAKAEKVLADAGYVFEDVIYADDVAVTVCVLAVNEDVFAEHVKSLSLGRTQPVLLGRKLAEMPVLPNS